MKKIALILLALLLIGCGNGGGIASVEYSSEGTTSSSIDVSSSESPLSSVVILSSSSSESVISSSSIGLSSTVISSSSSVIISSSSSLKQSSSSSNQIVSSSSVASSSSIEISSSSISSSSEMVSSSSAYKSALFLFDPDSALGLEFYVAHNGETSPMYEIIANKIKSYLTYYNWSSYPMGSTYVDDTFIFKSGTTIIVGLIKDNASPTSETIMVQSNDKIWLTQSGQYIFKASNEIVVAGKRTFVLQRTKSNEYICNWYDEIQSKWISAGFSDAITNNPFTTGVCSSLSNYDFIRG